MGRLSDIIMSEFFLELFSEETPPKLQTSARKQLFLDLKKLLLTILKKVMINLKTNIFKPSSPGIFMDLPPVFSTEWVTFYPASEVD